MAAPRLFGNRPDPPGPRVREVAALRRALIDADRLDPIADATTGVALDLARELDRLRRDPDRSAHNVAVVSRTLGDFLDRLSPMLAAGADPVAELLAELAAPVDVDT